MFKIVVTAVVAYFTYGAGTGLLGLSEYAATALAGFAGGLAGSGGNLKMGIIGAVTASAFYGVGSYFEGLKNAGVMCRGSLSAGQAAMKAIAHGVVGGVSSLASGGEFLTGFLSAGFTQATSNINNLYTQGKGINLGNAAKAAVVGGTASVLGGGKFANGAITGAFSRMFNDDGTCVTYGTRDAWELDTMNPDQVIVWDPTREDLWYPHGGAGSKIPIAGVELEAQLQTGTVKGWGQV